MREQTLENDLTVVGGGLAGVCAAIAAARLGKRVALVTNRPVLGGNSSSEIRVWVCGATAHGMQRFARETGIMGELYVENQYRNPEGNPVHWDEVVFDAVRAEPNIQLFLNTDVHVVHATGPDADRVIDHVRGWTMGSELWTTFRSTFYVDATGDGLVGALAGAHFRVGREGRDEFGESWAPSEPDGQFLGSTILFYTKDAGHPVDFVPPASAKDITTTPIPKARIIRSGDRGAHYWWIEWGGELDIVADNERIRDELRSVIFGIWDHIKNSGEFDAENLDLEWVGALPGKREYRRFVGDHTLTQNDILDQTEFPDAVAFGGWSIDLHPVEGMYATTAGAHQRFPRGVYGIPLRSYYSANVRNLFVAGRDISATHVAFGSSRVMATCAVGGEAVGTAASLAIDLGVSPRELATESAERLRQLLLAQDASVMGVRNDDPLDLARRARVSASSELRSFDPRSWSAEDPAGREQLECADDVETGDELFPLERDLGILIPVDPELRLVRVLVRTERDTTLHVSLYTTGARQNAVPAHRLGAVSVAVEAASSPRWIDLPLEWMPGAAENVVVVLHENRDVHVVLTDRPAPGVLLLSHRPENDGDANVAFDEADLLVQWPAHILRGRGLRFRVHPATEAFSASKAVGGYHRPYGGPQLWVSEPLRSGSTEWLELRFDEQTAVGEVRLVFDDDVDVELNTLHHHRTPHRVFPTLVRDYSVELQVDGEWQVVATITGNRRRHRIHALSARTVAQAVRVMVTATNGDPSARIVSVRVY
ncbi:FAD-dependent oxidoreductase [Humibacter ginsengisoli]